MTIADAAGAYASRGIFVFPVAGKVPVTEHGFRDAVTGRDAALELFGRHPDVTGIGLDCGRSGLLVVDLDGPDVAIELPATLEATTGRDGGRHLYLRTRDPRARNSTGKLGPGIDTRGRGGYVLLPPSWHPSGRRYTWTRRGPIADAPEWLLAALAPPPPPPVGDRRPLPTGERITTYGRVALEGLADRMLAARESTRHDTLLDVARRAGRLEAAGELDADLARAVLTEAALHAGLDHAETARTFRDAFNFGRQYPAKRAAR